jgi:hypothetical protein
VERPDAVGGELERGAQVVGDALERLLHVTVVDSRGRQVAAVEARRERAELGVATRAHPGDDLAHRGDGPVAGDVGAGQDRPQLGGGGAAHPPTEVQTLQHDRPTVSAASWPSLLVSGRAWGSFPAKRGSSPAEPGRGWDGFRG